MYFDVNVQILGYSLLRLSLKQVVIPYVRKIGFVCKKSYAYCP